MQGIVLVMMVINICRFKNTKQWMSEKKFCVPLHCLCAVDYLKILFAIRIFLKEIRWLSSHRWDCRINQNLTLWSSQWLIIHIYLFIYSTSFIFIAFWPVTIDTIYSLSSFTDITDRKYVVKCNSKCSKSTLYSLVLHTALKKTD